MKTNESNNSYKIEQTHFFLVSIKEEDGAKYAGWVRQNFMEMGLQIGLPC